MQVTKRRHLKFARPLFIGDRWGLGTRVMKCMAVQTCTCTLYMYSVYMYMTLPITMSSIVKLFHSLKYMILEAGRVNLYYKALVSRYYLQGTIMCISVMVWLSL